MLYDDSVSDRGSHRPWKTTNLTEIRTETNSLVVCLVLVYSYILDPDQQSVKVLGSYFNYSGETFFETIFIFFKVNGTRQSVIKSQDF